MQIPVTRISDEIYERLEAVQARPNAVNYFQKTSGKGWAVFGIIVGLLGLAGLIFVAIENRPEEELRYTLYAVTAVVALIFIGSFNHIRVFNRARVKPFRALNPLYFIELGWDELKYFKMWTLKDFRATHHLQNGVYQYTAFSLMFEEGNANFQVSPKPMAEKLFEQIKASNASLLQAVQSNNLGSLADHDFFGHALGREVEVESEVERPKVGMGCMAMLGLAAALGGVVGYGLIYLSARAYDIKDFDRFYASNIGWEVEGHLEYAACQHEEELPDQIRRVMVEAWTRDEKIREDEPEQVVQAVGHYNEHFGKQLDPKELLLSIARKVFAARWRNIGAPTPSAIVAHKAEMARFAEICNGQWSWGLTLADLAPHMNAVDEEIIAYIEQASADYKRQAEAAGADPEAIAAIVRIFEIMREERKYALQVSYEQALESDLSLEDQFKEAYPGYKYIEKMSPAFTLEKNMVRESMITDVLTGALDELLKGLITVTTYDSADAAVNLTVFYAISPSFELFYSEAEAELPDTDRHWYTGIFSEFQLTFREKEGDKELYTFEAFAEPANTFTPREFQGPYDAMAESLFNNFRVNFSNHFGVY